MGMQKLTSTAECRSTIEKEKLSVIFFKAEWASEQCRRVEELLNDMKESDDFQKVSFLEVEAEEVPEICIEHEVASVPAVLFFRKGEKLDRVDGFNASTLTNKIKYHASRSEFNVTVNGDNNPPNPSTNSNTSEPPQTMEQKLTALINQHRIMLFMKGDRNRPRCGFSNTIVQHLNAITSDYGTFDILEDEEVRQELKTFSNWQTYPQLYVDGELIGGLDIVKELVESGEFRATLEGNKN